MRWGQVGASQGHTPLWARVRAWPVTAKGAPTCPRFGWLLSPAVAKTQQHKPLLLGSSRTTGSPSGALGGPRALPTAHRR
jgi:hypothetical protein